MASEAQISRQEYLKRYLSSNKDDHNKKKKKAKIRSVSRNGGMRIIDVDISMKDIKALSTEGTIENDDDEAPFVADVIDERPQHVKIKEEYSTKNWKKLGVETDLDENADSSTATHQKNTQRHDSDSDQSPPRTLVEDKTIKENLQKNDNSFSSVMKGSSKDRRACEVLASKKHQSRLDSDSDVSPKRRNQQGSDSDMSPKRRNRQDSDSDLSPKRKNNGRTRQDSDSDMSPKRNSNRKNNQKSRQDSDSDLSPKRKSNKKTRQDSDSDLSPKRKSNKKTRQDSDSDLSPKRKSNRRTRQDSDSDTSLSVAQHISSKQTSVSLKNSTKQNSRDSKKNRKTRFDAQIVECKSEVEEECLNEKILLRGEKKAEDEKRKAEDEKKRSELEAKYSEWGRGMQQQEDQMKQFQSDAYETTKPLARYKDDDDLDRILRERDREGDPMLEYMRKQRKVESPQDGLPEYNGPAAPPNRFKIKPGYRWDGVDRSNGFEQKYFSKVNNTVSNETEAYLWSIQDM